MVKRLKKKMKPYRRRQVAKLQVLSYLKQVGIFFYCFPQANKYVMRTLENFTDKIDKDLHVTFQFLSP